MAKTKLRNLPTVFPDPGEITSIASVDGSAIEINDITYKEPETITICGENGKQLEFIRVDTVDDITYDEELRLRRENLFVKDLYEEYKVALILAGKNNGS